MSVIRRLQSETACFSTELRQLLAFEEAQDASIENACRDILHAVRQRGDDALIEFTQRFDGLSVSHATDLAISQEELQHALDALPTEQRAALEAAAQRVRQYHEHQRGQSWTYTEDDGTVLGQKITPLDRVGLYVPGGKAAYPSSVLMNAIPAKVAGVQESSW